MGEEQGTAGLVKNKGMIPGAWVTKSHKLIAQLSARAVCFHDCISNGNISSYILAPCLISCGM